MLILQEVEVKCVEELQEDPALLRKEVLKQNVEYIINKNRELRKDIDVLMSQTNQHNEAPESDGEENEWKRKYMDVSAEISLERKILLRETGKLSDACILSGIIEDYCYNDEDMTTDSILNNAPEEGSLYANYIVENRLNKVKRYIHLTREHIRLKDNKIAELQQTIKELEKTCQVSEDKPLRLPKQKPLPPVRKISREINSSSHVTKDEEVASFLRPRAATYSTSSSPNKKDTNLTLPKSPRSDPDLNSIDKQLFQPGSNSPRMKRRSGLSMIQAATAANISQKVSSNVNVKEVHFNLAGDSIANDGTSSPRRKFSLPLKLESYPYEKV